MNKITILLAVYNGDKYLKEQLDSIVNQSYSNWKLYIRDDGSTDKSVQIINEYVSQFSDKIHLIYDNSQNLGSCNNFFKLLECSENSKYYMFADQDDVWYEDKIEISLKKMKEIENKIGNNRPILIHTDLEVVDDKLKTISKSFWNYQKMDIEKGKLPNKLLIQNIITGCTVIFNNPLKDKLYKLPENVFVHDWWIALVASVFGTIEVLETPTIKYRQHSFNVAGAKFINLNHFIKRLFKLDEVKKGLRNSVFQAKVFVDIYSNQMVINDLLMFNEFSNLYKYGWLQRRRILFKYKIFKSNFARNIGLFLVA